jgi:hypothetical protein
MCAVARVAVDPQTRMSPAPLRATPTPSPALLSPTNSEGEVDFALDIVLCEDSCRIELDTVMDDVRVAWCCRCCGRAIRCVALCETLNLSNDPLACVRARGVNSSPTSAPR